LSRLFPGNQLGCISNGIGICALPASLIAGFLWDNINMQASFYLSLVLSLVACFMLLFVKENSCNTG
jgi:MFS-type transporter involved in bile tolerance (Atg22 family)